jgi:hypothetical protein
MFLNTLHLKACSPLLTSIPAREAAIVRNCIQCVSFDYETFIIPLFISVIGFTGSYGISNASREVYYDTAIFSGRNNFSIRTK